MKKQSADKLEVQVYQTRAELGTAAATLVAERINDLLKTQQHVNMIFAAAPSQNEFLAALVSNTSIDWERINAFHMDEYIGLPADSEQTFAWFLKHSLFGKLPFRMVNYINGNAADLQAECERYADLLNQYPTDIVCMGIGENGHLAFNDPPVADFNDPAKVKIVTLDAGCRQQQVNDGCFPMLTDVPRQAITLTIPALMAAKYAYCMVPGEKKANAVFNTLNKEIAEQYPSTILRKHPNAVLFLDAGSSSLLY